MKRGAFLLCAGLFWFALVTVIPCPLPADAGQQITASLAAVNPPDVIIVRGMSLFAKKVGEKSNNGLVINVAPSGQLGGMKEAFEAVMAGTLEAAQVNNAFLGTLYPGTQLFDLPFVFRDNEHMQKVVRGPIGQQVYAELEKRTGIKILMSGLADGPRSVFNRRRAIYSPEDMKGIKIRVMQSPLMVDTFKALGAIPTPLPAPDVYMAMKQGVVDGAETPPFGVFAFKAYEVAKYYSLTKHFAMPSALGLSVKWFNGLSADHQRAILAAADEARAWYDQQFDAENVMAFKDMKEKGMEVNDVKDLQQFRDAMKPVYDKYAGQVGGWSMIQAVLDTK